MCGLFGVVRHNRQPIDRDRVVRARDRMFHRGPDDAGLYESVSGCAVLAHRRLSIIELSPLGHQPMTTDDGRYTIVFNGEIYNFAELAKDLTAKGVRLKSRSDTEVLLHLYAMEGDSCLSKLRGMFAFAIWDEREKQCFLARDQFGIKPLYWSCLGDQFIFSSELKAIKSFLGSLSLSMPGAESFLRHGSIPAPLTIYESVHALMPGCMAYFTLGASQPVLRTWFSLENIFENPAPVVSYGFNQMRQEAFETLLDSVRHHCVSDVPVGAFLSAGIDSTALVSLMLKAGQSNIQTVTLSFPDSEYDEAEIGERSAKHFGTEHTTFCVTEDDLFADFERILSAMDQPTIDGVNIYFVAKVASEVGLKVVVSGVGGDEFFAGYGTFQTVPRIATLLAFLDRVPGGRALLGVGARVLSDRLPPKAMELESLPANLMDVHSLTRALFSEKVLASLGSQCLGVAPDLHIESNPSRLTALQTIALLETQRYLGSQLLRDADVFSMAHSLELRVPYVDSFVAAYALNRIDHFFDAAVPKRLLWQAVGDLPISVTSRRKTGFGFPFQDWMLRGRLRSMLFELAAESPPDFFAPDMLSGFAQRLDSGQFKWAHLWALAVLGWFSKNSMEGH